MRFDNTAAFAHLLFRKRQGDCHHTTSISSGFLAPNSERASRSTVNSPKVGGHKTFFFFFFFFFWLFFGLFFGGGEGESCGNGSVWFSGFRTPEKNGLLRRAQVFLFPEGNQHSTHLALWVEFFRIASYRGEQKIFHLGIPETASPGVHQNSSGKKKEEIPPGKQEGEEA